MADRAVLPGVLQVHPVVDGRATAAGPVPPLAVPVVRLHVHAVQQRVHAVRRGAELRAGARLA